MAYNAVLKRHPGSVSDAAKEIEAGVRWNDDGALAFTYILSGDLIRLRIPPSREPRRADRLWEHTCFEAFVAVKDQPAYYEINLAPSGEWALYAFHRYREPGPPLTGKLAPEITVRRTTDSLELNATPRMDCFDAIEPGSHLSVALCAVIEDNRGILTYWALAHPRGKPDFHHRDGFALEIRRPAEK
jgi:hypothetical protein